MRWLLITAVMLSPIAAWAQMPMQSQDDTPDAPTTAPMSTTDTLPDAPSEVLVQQANVVVVGEASLKASGKAVEPCNPKKAIRPIFIDPGKVHEVQRPCTELVYPYQRFLNANIAIPLSWQQKGYLALHDVTDLANLGTIAGVSAITFGASSHTAYGTGWSGYGKIVGVSLLQDATGSFFGTFLIPSIADQDPRYYRMPNAPVHKRILYSVSRTFISRHDDGSPMPNYGTLLTYPINSELSNFYVPGIHADAASTVERIVTGLAIDPANNLIAEFLPDVAKHVHVRIIFVQQILNNIAANQGSTF
ncbi:MAG: hypothetical protein JWP98_1096 [Edaphobacter sp.]|nr:hypothetical protein [Edaphobacter sp.]